MNSPSARDPASSSSSARWLRWPARALVAVTWLSAALFGLFILARYGGAVPSRLDDWNLILPSLYDRRAPLASVAIGLHFAAGAVLSLLGPLQLFAGVRARHPALHRNLGRLYVLAALAAGAGGLVFIARQGTIGGRWMSLGFGGYGALMVVAAVATLGHAVARRLPQHRAWALRLFALTVGSWLYRMDYGFWSLLDGRGHTRSFDGWFDVVMDFWFYLPNLAVAELFIRASRRPRHRVLDAAAAVGLGLAAAFLALATYFFARYYWLPALVARIAGA